MVSLKWNDLVLISPSPFMHSSWTACHFSGRSRSSSLAYLHMPFSPSPSHWSSTSYLFTTNFSPSFKTLLKNNSLSEALFRLCSPILCPLRAVTFQCNVYTIFRSVLYLTLQIYFMPLTPSLFWPQLFAWTTLSLHFKMPGTLFASLGTLFLPSSYLTPRILANSFFPVLPYEIGEVAFNETVFPFS